MPRPCIFFNLSTDSSPEWLASAIYIWNLNPAQS
jgi:hypothetical protein